MSFLKGMIVYAWCGIVFLSVVYGTLLGGREDVDVNNNDAIEAGKTAFDELAMRKNSLFESKFLRLTSAEKQVVSGVNWWLTFHMGQTDCEKDFEHPKQELDKSCRVTQIEECKVKLYVVPWEHKTDLQEFQCTPQGSLVGGPQKQTQISPEAQQAAAFAVEHVNQEKNNAYRVALADIASVHTQVVAGVKYSISLKLGATKCKNNEKNKKATLKECPIYGAKTKDCDVEVIHASWIAPPFTVISCGCCKKIVKRDVVLGSLDAQMLGSSPILVHGQSLGSQDAENLNVKHAAYWMGFKNKFDKKYSSEEEAYRFGVFRNNMVKAETMQRAERGTAMYGITPFSDLTEEEFSRMLSKKWDLSVRPSREANIPNTAAPDSYDWRQHGAVTPVKNQGQCGSCWAFSTTGNVEGQWKLKKGSLLSLSEQELVDCDKVDQGCEGGLPSNAYKAIMKLGGLELETDYKYDGADETCKFAKSKARVFVNDSVAISKDEAEMAAWLAKNGPISIGINANAMQWYMGGISHPWKILCNPSSLDHGVLIVGYGVENGTPYWIIKNSWGPSWGEEGYYRVYRGAGVCGVNQMATSAVVD